MRHRSVDSGWRCICANRGDLNRVVLPGERVPLSLGDFQYRILFYPLLPLLFIALWFYRFGNVELGDKDYLTAKRRLKGSLLLWLTILVVQCLALAALLKFNN